jgi:hypothetical protein
MRERGHKRVRNLREKRLESWPAVPEPSAEMGRPEVELPEVGFGSGEEVVHDGAPLAFAGPRVSGREPRLGPALDLSKGGEVPKEGGQSMARRFLLLALAGLGLLAAGPRGPGAAGGLRRRDALPLLHHQQPDA